MSDIEKLERLNLITTAAQEIAKTFQELNNNFTIEDIKKAASSIVTNDEEMMLFIVTVLIPDDEEFLAKRREFKNDANRLSKYYKVELTIITSKLTIIAKKNYLMEKTTLKNPVVNESKESDMKEELTINQLIQRLNDEALNLQTQLSAAQTETVNLQTELSTVQTEKTIALEENENLKNQLSVAQEALAKALAEADKYRAMNEVLLKYKRLVDGIMVDIEILNSEFNIDNDLLTPSK